MKNLLSNKWFWITIIVLLVILYFWLRNRNSTKVAIAAVADRNCSKIKSINDKLKQYYSGNFINTLSDTELNDLVIPTINATHDIGELTEVTVTPQSTRDQKISAFTVWMEWVDQTARTCNS